MNLPNQPQRIVALIASASMGGMCLFPNLAQAERVNLSNPEYGGGSGSQKEKTEKEKIDQNFDNHVVKPLTGAVEDAAKGALRGAPGGPKGAAVGAGVGAVKGSLGTCVSCHSERVVNGND